MHVLGAGATEELGPDGVVLVDFATPYAFAHAGRRGSSFTTHIRYADLGLDVDAVRAAMPRLGSSALLPLVRGHLVQMRASVGEFAAHPTIAADLAAATVDLTRALIVSAAGDRRERDVLHGALRARVVATSGPTWTSTTSPRRGSRPSTTSRCAPSTTRGAIRTGAWRTGSSGSAWNGCAGNSR